MTPEEIAAKLFSGPCNCAAPDIGVGIMHEPMCRWPNEYEVAVAIREAIAQERERCLDFVACEAYVCGCATRISAAIREGK